MPTGFHKLGIGAGFVALLQTLTLPVICFAMLYASAYLVGDKRAH